MGTNPLEDVKLDIYTWNVEWRGNPEEIDNAIFQTLKRTPQIVCLQEANLPKNSKGTRNFNWLCSGEAGSAVLVSRRLRAKTNFVQVCEQICIAEIENVGGIKIKVISCYIPPPEFVIEELWGKLEVILKSIPSNMTLVLAGDFNAEIGSNDLTESDKLYFGKHLYHNKSDGNGVRLKNLAKSAHMRAGCTFSNAPPVEEHIFTCRGRSKKSQQSFIMFPLLRDTFPRNIVNEWHPHHNHALHGTSLEFTEKRKEIFGRETIELRRQPKMILSTWNTEGAPPAQLDSIFIEQNLPIICVQELSLSSGEDDIKTENYLWYHSKKACTSNVGIAVRKSQHISLTDFQCLSERLCVADVVFYTELVKVICCHLMPPNDPRNATVQTQIVELVKGITEKTFFILAGDFSTDLSSVNPPEGGDYDENSRFLCQLVEDAKLCMKKQLWGQFSSFRNKMICRVTDTEKSMPHHILMPYSIRVAKFTKLFVRWIPFFHNAIFCLFQRDNESNIRANKKQGLVLKFDKIMSTVKKVTDENVEEELHVRERRVYEEKGEDSEPQQPYALSAEDVQRFSHTPPSAEELGRILQDFVVYFRANTTSCVISTPFSVLTSSFGRGGFGKATCEVSEIVEESGNVMMLCRIKWRGILLAEQMTGVKYKGRIKYDTALDVLRKLSQMFYTVKGKRSFFNKGVAPMLLDDPRLSHVIKKVNRETVPTMAEVTKFIDDFFSEDSDCELVFGPQFSEGELLDIMDHAETCELGYRFFATNGDVKRVDNIAVFITRSPRYLRDQLLKNPENWKYCLLPPVVLGNDFKFFHSKYEGEHFKEESKIVKQWLDTNSKRILPSAIFEDIRQLVTKLRKLRRNKPHTSELTNMTRTDKCDESIHTDDDEMREHKEEKKLDLDETRDSDDKNQETSNTEPQQLNPVSAEDVHRFSHTPPSAEELGRILQDFVVYFRANTTSCVISTPFSVLNRSFSHGNFGSFSNEVLEITEDFEEKLLCRIRWNGVLLIDWVSNTKNKQLLRDEAALEVLKKLCQTCYTVKSRRSFFNKGVAPILVDDPRLSQVIKKVDKETLPTMAEATKYIDDFFSEDSDCELVFGPQFSEEELLEVMKYAKSRDMGYRFFATHLDVERMDNVAVFINRTPQNLRDQLLKKPENWKYCLLPPVGLGNDYASCHKKYEEEHFEAEERLVQQWVEKHSKKTLAQAIFDNIHQKSSNAAKQSLVKPKSNKKSHRSGNHLTRDLFSPQQSASYQETDAKRPPRERRPSPVWDTTHPGSTYQASGMFPLKRWLGEKGDQWLSAWDEAGPLPCKRRKMESPPPPDLDGAEDKEGGSCEEQERCLRVSRLPRVELPLWSTLGHLTLVWPFTVQSKEEDDLNKVLQFNFPTEFQRGPNNKVAAIVTLPLSSGRERKFCLCVEGNVDLAGKYALLEIQKHCTIIKPNPVYLCEAGVPNFLSHKVPCQSDPSTYQILSHEETGPLTQGRLQELFGTLKASFNEDIYFDKNVYTLTEKLRIIEEAPKFDLLVRHFGDEGTHLEEHYVCVSKKKPKAKILEEVLKMRGTHPKYILVRDNLGPSFS